MNFIEEKVLKVWVLFSISDDAAIKVLHIMPTQIVSF